MKHFILKILGLALIFTGFIACSDDDDDNPPIVINDIMVVYNSDNGVFSSINTTDGTLTALGSVTFEGATLTGLRDIVYNSANGTVYASARSDYENGEIYSINPETLVATVLNDNAEDDWYALPGIEMSNGKIIGTVYWDNYELEYYSGLVLLNLDGTISETIELMYEGVGESFYEGMAIEYGSTMNELLITDVSDVIICDLNGTISEIIELTGEGFPMEESLDGIRSLETGDDGVLYGIDRDGHFGSINLTTGVFTYIATLPSNKIMGLSNVPETVFEEN